MYSLDTVYIVQGTFAIFCVNKVMEKYAVIITPMHCFALFMEMKNLIYS